MSNKATLLCLAMAACASDDPAHEGPYALARRGSDVIISEPYRDCDEHTDCVLMNVTCDSCCERDAIRIELVSEFMVAKRAACADYSGAECVCEEQPLIAQCVERRCVAVPSDAGG